jgi:SPP1 family predicted phage head-tail adaptor
MRSGLLRERVVFQTKTEVSDGMGSGGTETWSDTLSGVPAAVWPMRGDELVDNMKLEQRIDYRIRTRWDSAINSAMRIKWIDHQGTTHYLDIVDGPRNTQGTYRMLEMLAEEKDA